MSNSKIILDKAKKQAAQLAKDVARQASHEILEIPESVPGELVGVKPNQTSPIVEALQQQTETSAGGVTDKGLKNEKRIEEEMARWRRIREEEINKSQEPKVADETTELSEPGSPILPSSPSRRRQMGGQTKSQTKIEAKLGKD